MPTLKWKEELKTCTLKGKGDDYGLRKLPGWDLTKSWKDLAGLGSSLFTLDVYNAGGFV